VHVVNCSLTLDTGRTIFVALSVKAKKDSLHLVDAQKINRFISFVDIGI
jgi:hypothetical protein